MVGVGPETKGGMWSVAKAYLNSEHFNSRVQLQYISTATAVTNSSISKATRAISGCSKAVRCIDRKKVDLVHVHMAERGSFFRKSLIVREAHRKGIKIVLHMHGGSFKSFYDASEMHVRQYITKTLRMADAIIVLGECFRTVYESVGVDGRKITVIPNGVQVPAFSGSVDHAKDVIFLGVITASKGVFELLDAASTLSPLFRDRHKFKLFGPKAEIDIDNEIAIRKLGDFVEYCGFLDSDKKQKQFEHTCLAVLPSHFEVLPMCILETMAYGIPNVASNVGSIDSVIVDGRNGNLVPPRDVEALTKSIGNLLQDANKRARLGVAARKTVTESFSETKHIESVLKTYDLVCEGRLNDAEF